MPRNSVIFISAVSSELRTTRDLVAKTLFGLGFEPKWQDVAPMDSGQLLGVLRKWVDESAGLVQLVGHCYGCGPDRDDSEFGAYSYTQYEAIYAKQRGKPVWYLVLDEAHPKDGCRCQSPNLHERQRAYRDALQKQGALFYTSDSLARTEATVLKLRDELARLRNRSRQWAILVVFLLCGILGGISWLIRSQAHEITGITTVLQRYNQLEQALIKLADAEIHVRQVGENLTQAEFRSRAYRILEQELGFSAGTLSKELPAFALEVYSRAQASLAMRAHAAYALNKFDEAESLFLESNLQDQLAQANAEAMVEKLRKQRIVALFGAGSSAWAQFEYGRAYDHYVAAAALTENHGDSIERAQALVRVGYAMNVLGQFDGAESVSRESVKLFQKYLGDEHADTLDARLLLVVALGNQGQNSAAEAEAREVLALRCKVLGDEHPDTLTARRYVATAAGIQRRNAEAEREYRSIITAQQRIPTINPREVLMTYYYLGQCLMYQGKLSESLEYATRARDGLQKERGEKHPDTGLAQRLVDTLTSMKNLSGNTTSGNSSSAEEIDALIQRYGAANALMKQRDFSAAESEHRQVLKERERLLGAVHPDVLSSCYKLALCLESLGNRTAALPMAKRAFDGDLKLFGDDHPFTRSAYQLLQRLDSANDHKTE